jgi:short-subunit dehydrogenase
MNIIVTGASRGIGYELVKKLASANNKILVMARSRKLIEQLADECNRTGKAGSVYPLPFDLNTIHEGEELVKHAITAHLDDRVDSLINNAGRLVNKPFDEIGSAETKDLFTTNLFAPIYLIQICLQYFKLSANPAILNISSMGGIQGTPKFPGLSIYSASKGALGILTECLAEEFKDKNVKVNCLALGAVETEMFKEAFPGYDAPLKASEVGEFIADFVNTGFRYFNGKILPVAVTTP